MRRMRDEAPAFLYATLGLWLGIYSFRTFVPTAVWNLSDALPLYAKGAIAIGVNLAGMVGCVLPLIRKPHNEFRLAVAVALLTVARQVWLGSDVWGSAFSLLAWIVWLWWLAAFARHAAEADTRRFAV